jgi:antitoxin component of MazEF toxin-antitoxin module
VEAQSGSPSTDAIIKMRYMVIELKLQKFGDTVALAIPDDVLSQMNVGEGDSVFLVQDDDHWKLTAAVPESIQKTRAFQKIASRYDKALNQLAE